MDTQQTPRHDYVSDLYDALIESGKYDASELAGNKDNFRNAMSSKETRKAMYDWIAGNEDFDIGPYDTYEVDLASSYDTEAEDLKALAAQVKPTTTPEPQKPKTIAEQYDRESVGEQLWQPFTKTNEEVEYTPSPVINAEEADKVGAPLSAMDKAVYTANTQALLDNLKASNKATEKRLAGIGNQSPTLTEEVVQGEDGPTTIYHTPDGRTFNNKVEATLSMEDTARAIETKSVEGLEQRLARLEDAANERREGAAKEWQDDFTKKHEAAKKGSLWDEVAFAMVNTTPQSYASGAMATVQGDPEYRAYNAAKVLTEGTINMIREAEKSMADGRGLGAWTKAVGRGFGDTFADPRTWDLGVGDLLDSTAVLEAAKAFDEAKGDMSKLTPAQRELLNAVAVDTAYRAMYEDAMSSGYTAGSVTAAALPFIAQMMLGGSNSVAQLVTKGAYKAVLKAVKGGIKNKALRYTTKALTKGIGNLGSAAFMTGTFGTGTSLADANRRMTGNATPVISESGEIVYGGRKGAEDAGTALRKAYTKTFIEYYSERLGDSMGDAVDALADVTGVTSLMKKAFEKLPKKTAPITELIKSGQWHGLFGEYAEEVAGGALNAALVGDVTTDDLLSMDYHKETLEGLLPMSIAFGILGSTSYRTQGYIARKNLRAAQDALRAQGIYSIEDLHLTTENTLSQIEEVANSDNFSIAQKQAIISYLKAEQAVLETEKGQQAAEELMSEENITLGRDLEKDFNIGIAAWNSTLEGNNEQAEQVKSEYEEARAQFDEKQLAEMDKLTNNELFEYLNNHKKQARTIWDYLRKRQRYIAIDMAEKDVARAEEKIGAEIEMGRAQGAAITPEEVDAKGAEAIAALDEISSQLTAKERNDLDNEGISATRKAANPQAAEDYLSAKAYVEGMYEGARSQADAVAQKAAEEVQSRTHAEDGQIYTATTNGGESVNVVRGKITLNADGTIDLGASDKGITIVDEAGNKKMISSRELKSLEVANGAEAQQVASEAAKQTYLQKLEALFNAPTPTQLEQQAAELEEEQMQMDAANRAVQQAEIINGSNVAIEVNGTQYPGQVMIVEDGGAVVDFGRPIIYNGRRSRTHQIPVNELTNLDAIARETESQASAEQPQAQTTPDTQGSARFAEQPVQEEVDYDALLERDPAEFLDKYDAEVGTEVAQGFMKGLIEDTRKAVKAKQTAMKKAVKSPNQYVALKREADALQGRLELLEEVYDAKYNAPKVEDSASLAEQSTPEEIEPSPQEAVEETAIPETQISEQENVSPIENKIAEWSKKVGVPVSVYRSVDEIPNAQARAAINAGQAVRGWYEQSTGAVAFYLPNLNSEAEVDEVFAHEVVSHKGLRGLLGQEKFDALCDKVWDMMSEADREFYMNYPGVNGDKRAAADEYMAHLAEKVDLTNEERTIWQSIVDFVKKALLGIKATLSDKNIEDLIRMSYRELRKGGEDVSLPTQEGEQALFSISTYEQSGREKLAQFVKKEVKSKRLTQQEGEDLIKQMDALYEVCVAFKDKYEPFGNWSDAAVVVDEQGKPVFSVIKANGDYAMNLDFSLVCKKRRTLDAVFRRMIDRGIINNYELGQVDLAKINQIIREHGFETACRLCFVDAKRFRVAQVADAFCDMYNPLTKMSDKQLREVSKKEGNSTIGKTARMLLKHPENKVELSRENFMDSKGFEDMAVNSKEILKLYNAKKGTGGPKASYGDTQYMNDILGKKWTPESAYAVGGVRLQSFSDYVPRMVFDYMQMVADIAAKKLPVHSYTKEPIFAKQFGLTGIKINLSLVPRVEADGIAPGLDAKGNYVWQEGETFPYEEAIAIQNADGYKANCGTIAVGVSDAHIEKMLSDENIRMVIPYHKSGLNLIVAKFNNIDAFKDYTNEQNTRNADGTKLDEKQMKSHFNFNADLHEHGNPRKAAQNYLEWCDKMGYIPKFDKFRDHPNYYKLLEDFTTCVTENGVDTFVPQGPVTMTFPDESSAFGSIADLIEQGLEEDAVLEGNRQANLDNIVDDIVEEFDGAPIEESEDWGNKKDAKWGLRFSIKPEDIPEQFQPGHSAKNAVSAENEERLKEMADMTSAQLYGGAREEYGYNCNSWLEAMAPVARRGEGFHYYQYVQGLLKAHPELDFAARLENSSDKDVVSELKQQFDGITDLTSVKLVQDAMLYYAKGVAFNSSTRFVRAVNKAAKERSEAIKEEMGRVLNVGTSMDVKRGEVGIEWVKETFDKLNKDEAVGALFERVYDVAKQLKLRVAITNLRGTTRGEYFGDFVRYDARMLNSNLTEDQTKASILLHELIHSVTSYAIYAAKDANAYSRVKTTPEMVKAVRILDGVYGTLKREGALDEMYAMTNVSEMVAELSNPAFREELKKRNLWQKIVDAIKTIFGLDRKTDDTMLTAASDALEYLLDNFDRAAYNRYLTLAMNTDTYGKMQNTFKNMEESVRFSVALTPEEQAIVDKAKADGTYLKAPNGKATNLSPKQWAQVRTEAFKKWFGDWENNPQDSSKILDENGEPKVVYHQTNAKEYVNVETGENWDDLDWQAKQEWEDRDDWDEYWQEQDFYEYSRKNARTTHEFDGFFFAPEYDEYHEYGERTIPAFLNIRKPATSEDYNIDGTYNEAGKRERERLQEEGFDGVIRYNEDGSVDEYIAFEPNQIKSATENVGTFDAENNDIRFSIVGPSDRKVTFENFYNGTSAVFTPIEKVPNRVADFTSRSGSRYWYGEDKQGRYVIRQSDHWSESINNESVLKKFNEHPDSFKNIASCFWAIDMRGYKAQANELEPIQDIKSVDYNTDRHRLNIRLKNGQNTHREGVHPRDMKPYFDAVRNNDYTAANEYITNMVNEKYTSMILPMPKAMVGKAYLEDFTAWEVTPNRVSFSMSPEQIEQGVESANSKQKVVRQRGEGIVDDIRFSIGRNRQEQMYNTLGKRRPELTDQEKKAVIAELDKIDDNKVVNAAFHYFANGTIRIPEDMPKVEQAVKVASIAKVDPAAYRSPMELIDAHADIKIKDKRIDPDTVPTLSNKVDYGNGITVYDVEESQESRENMRKIINTHFGEESSPWCLLQGDGKGHLTPQSEKYWEHYSAYPKRVAFKDGKLSAFFASDNKPTWWDRQDEPHDGIPVIEKLPDGSGRVGTVEFDEDTREYGDYTDIRIGERGKSDLYEEWEDEDTLVVREVREGDTIYCYEYVDGEVLKYAERDASNYQARKFISFDLEGGIDTIREQGITRNYNNGKVFRVSNSSQQLYVTWGNKNQPKTVQGAASDNVYNRVEFDSQSNKVAFVEVSDENQGKVTFNAEYGSYHHYINGDALIRCSFVEDGKLTYCSWSPEGALRQYREDSDAIYVVDNEIISDTEGTKGWTMSDAIKAEKAVKEAAEQRTAELAGWARDFADQQYEESQTLYEREMASAEERNNTRFSVATTPSEEQYSVKEAYDNRLSKRRTKLREEMMDDGIAIKILQDLIAQETGEPIADIANVYLHRNHMNSRSTQEIGYYEQKFGERIMEALRKFIKRGAKLKDIEKYLIAKHGLERNDYMNWREAVRKAAEQKRKKELKDYDNLVTTAKELGLPKPESKVKSVGEYEREYFAQYNEAIANLSNEEYTARRREIMNSIVPYNFSEGRDQSGLTETLGYDPKKEDAVEYEVLTEEAHRIVEQFESEYNTALIEELWDSIKASAGFSLTKNRNTGQISNEYHDNASKMYRYYVPLRGWEKDKAEDVYAYEDVPNTGTTNRADLKAAGRRSKPDSPFATLANMAYTAIVQGNKNRANMSLLNLARMYPSDALSVHRIWEVLDEDTGDWVVAEPKLTTSNAPQGESSNEALNWAVENGGTVAADLAAYEEEMKALQKEGKARPVTGKIDSHLHFTNQQLKQHAVTVRVNGTPYIVWVNGNPRVAQTLNGLTRKQLEDWQRGLKAMTRWLSSVFTSKNPAFWVGNGYRDLWYSEYRARTMFGMEYATRYTKNYGIVAAKIWELQRNGQLNAFDPSEDMGKIQQYYNEFIRNGGPTGYAYLKDVQELKGEMQTALKDMEKSVSFRRGWEKFDKNMDAISGAIETIPRLAAYITSRESGRSILDSISDAKEVTTNFDRKGGRLNQGFGVAWAFFNASVQGVQNFLNTVKEHPVKATMEIAGRAALGVYGVNILNMALAALFGDDPDEVMDQYFALPDYIRRHNLCFYIGGDWVKIPLPQTLRVFYGIGDIINKATHGYAHYDNIPADIASLLGDFFPINLVGAENWGSAVWPTALSPIDEVRTNTDYRGMPIANQTIFNQHLPEWQRTYGDESAPAVLISRALSRLSGGSKYKRGAIEFNPAYIDHLVKGYLGGVGTFITKGANTIEWGAKELAEKVSGGAYQNPEEFMWRGTPISSRLLQDAPTGDNNFRLNQAYSYWRDFYEKHNTQKRGYEDELESGNLEDVDDFIKVMMDEGTMDMFHDLDREIRKLYKEKDKMEDPAVIASLNELIKTLKQRAVQMMEDEYFSDKKKPVFQERLRKKKAEEKKRKASKE